LIAYASIHGNTKNVAEKMAEILKEKGETKVAMADLTRDDMAEAIEDAFRYGRVILAASSYNAGVFPPMEQFLHHLKGKNYQKRRIGLIENGSWAPSAARCMKEILTGMKEVEVCEPVVTVRASLKEENLSELETLAEEILK